MFKGCGRRLGGNPRRSRQWLHRAAKRPYPDQRRCQARLAGNLGGEYLAASDLGSRGAQGSQSGSAERLGFVTRQIKEIEEARQKRLEQEPETEPHAMVRHLVRVVGVGVETADMLVNEVLSRPMRDRKAVARYAGLTGSPDESGAKRREQGLARAGNARVRRGMVQLAWRFLWFQKESALARWYQARTADSRAGTRKTMIVALARKLLIALWRFVTTGETLEGVILRPAG
jgi:transposase